MNSIVLLVLLPQPPRLPHSHFLRCSWFREVEVSGAVRISQHVWVGLNFAIHMRIHRRVEKELNEMHLLHARLCWPYKRGTHALSRSGSSAKPCSQMHNRFQKWHKTQTHITICLQNRMFTDAQPLSEVAGDTYCCWRCSVGQSVTQSSDGRTCTAVHVIGSGVAAPLKRATRLREAYRRHSLRVA